MALINTVDYESRRYQQNRQKNPLPSSYFSPSIIQFTSRDQNNLIIMYRLPKVNEQDSPLAAFLKIHSCNLAKFLVSILDPLTRNQLSVRQIMFTSVAKISKQRKKIGLLLGTTWEININVYFKV